MNKTLTSIGTKVGEENLIQSCSRDGCRVYMTGVPSSRVIPILFHGQGLHPKQRKDLNRAKVRIQGVDFSIKTARCGRPRNLAQALSPHAGA